MILAAFNFGLIEMFAMAVALLLIVLVGNFGKNTFFGYWGSILLAILTTPVIAYLIILFTKRK